MSWRAITEADVVNRMGGPELEGLRAAALADGQSDPVAATIALIVSKVRRACISNGNITMGAAGTIPEDLLTEALDLIVWEIMKRPGAAILDDKGSNARHDAVNKADKVLHELSVGLTTIADASGDSSAGFVVDEAAKSYQTTGSFLA